MHTTKNDWGVDPLATVDEYDTRLDSYDDAKLKIIDLEETDVDTSEGSPYLTIALFPAHMDRDTFSGEEPLRFYLKPTDANRAFFNSLKIGDVFDLNQE